MTTRRLDGTARELKSQESLPGSSESKETLGNRDDENTVRNNNNDGGEKGESNGPPQPVGFWDKSLNKTRLQVFGLWARTTLMLAAFILLVLSMYWGVLFHVEQNVSSLVVYVVDFDAVVEPYTGVTPLIGPMITQMTEEILRSPAPHLGYDIILPSVFDNDPLQVREAVYHQKAWAAIVINPNATTLLQHAVEQGNTSYDPLGACQVIYVAARDQETLYSYILPQLSSLQSEAISAFGKMWTGMVLQNSSIPRTNLQRVPQALSPAIGFSQFDLRPFSPAVTTPAVSIGLIYLIIISFFSFLFYFPIHMRFLSPQGHPPLKFWQFIAWRWFANIAAYFFMSLAYSLISLAFQIPFANPSAPATAVATNPNAYGKGTFVVYWMINFVGMISLGLACENVTMVIGQPWTAMWLIFWVITNVATSFYAIDLAPRFYYWGYAWPLHNIVEASRSTLFDLHSRIGLNLGILFVWCAINTALFPFCCYILKRKGERQRKAAMQEKK